MKGVFESDLNPNKQSEVISTLTTSINEGKS